MAQLKSSATQASNLFEILVSTETHVLTSRQMAIFIVLPWQPEVSHVFQVQSTVSQIQFQENKNVHITCFTYYSVSTFSSRSAIFISVHKHTIWNFCCWRVSICIRGRERVTERTDSSLNIYCPVSLCYVGRRTENASLIVTLTEVFPWFFLICKANAMIHDAKSAHGPHSLPQARRLHLSA